jgi:hypothetical protein
MNKRKFARVMALHRDGVPKETCAQCIIGMSSSAEESVIWLNKFYSNIYEAKVKELEDKLTDKETHHELTNR